MLNVTNYKLQITMRIQSGSLKLRIGRPHFRITSPWEVTDQKTEKIISLWEIKP
jgi:hypothetical protein